MSAMDADRWARLSSWLDRALDAPREEREAWLQTLAESDPAAAGEVRELLHRGQALVAAGFLEHGPSPWDQQQSALAGRVIGAYTLVRPIGSGGTGHVWLAVRSDGRFEGHVAVKLLNLALIGREGEERFRREGNILARLTHEGIAHLIDAGASDEGQPYLILEYVDGQRIDRYCDDHSLPVDARVRLMLDVLSAVDHAHAHLIVHRDLKPSNVFVRADGRVKLLDFGIAKLLEPYDGLGTPATLTRDGSRVLTPEYAAPEQLTGHDVTVATDVYALGVLLYELVTGRHPTASASTAPADLVKAVVDTEPLRPSAVRRTLSRDLDTIITKALKKNPEERYGSVAAFADDLRRYLRHEPVRARPDSWSYRAALFTRRHRWAVAGVALTVSGLSVGLYVANRERAVAQARFNEVRGLSNRLFDLDARVRGLPGATAARQLIVDTALEYLHRLSPDPSADPDLALDVGTAYMRVARIQGVSINVNLGQADQAEKNLETAGRLLEGVLVRRPESRLAILRAAQIAHDRMVLAEERNDDARTSEFALQSATFLDRYLATGPVEAAEASQFVVASMNVANGFLQMGRLADAVARCRRTIEIAQQTNQPNQAAAAMLVLTLAYREEGRLHEARTAAHDAAATLESFQSRGTGPQMTLALALLREAQVLAEEDGVSLDQPEEAVPLYERAIAITDRIAADDPHDWNSRRRLSTAAIRLLAVLSPTNPVRALEVSDLALRRLGEVPANTRARANEASLLARSSASLHRLGRYAEAGRRLDQAFALLKTLSLYPAETVALGSEVDDALRAMAAHDAATGNADRAAKAANDLLSRVRSGARSTTVLSDAASLSGLLDLVARLHRQAGGLEQARALEAERDALWRHWDRQLPRNDFVQRQLADASRSAPRP